MRFKYFQTRETLTFLSVVVFFIAVAVFSYLYTDELKNLVQAQGIIGIIAYLLLLITAVVVAPVSVFPLLPLAVVLWGVFVTVVLNVIGLTIGAMIAFGLARYFGRPLIKKFKFLKKVEELEGIIPEKYLFLTVILLRMIFPVDILSYAIGLFTKMHWFSYLIATFLGILPFYLVFAYGLNLSVKYQILIGAFGILIILFSYNHIRKRIFIWLKNKNV